MADGWLLQDGLDDIEHVDAVNRMRIERRRLRDHFDPFQMTEWLFCRLFRFDKNSAAMLIEELEPRLQRQRAHGLSVHTQVIVNCFITLIRYNITDPLVIIRDAVC